MLELRFSLRTIILMFAPNKKWRIAFFLLCACSAIIPLAHLSYKHTFGGMWGFIREFIGDSTYLTSNFHLAIDMRGTPLFQSTPNDFPHFFASSPLFIWTRPCGPLARELPGWPRVVCDPFSRMLLPGPIRLGWKSCNVACVHRYR